MKSPTRQTTYGESTKILGAFAVQSLPHVLYARPVSGSSGHSDAMDVRACCRDCDPDDTARIDPALPVVRA